MDTWRASRQKLMDELADVEGKKGLTNDEAAIRKLIASLQSRIAQLDDLIGAKRDSRDA